MPDINFSTLSHPKQEVKTVLHFVERMFCLLFDNILEIINNNTDEMLGIKRLNVAMLIISVISIILIYTLRICR